MTAMHATTNASDMPKARPIGTSDVPIGLAFGMTLAFVVACVAVIAFIFRTGWRLRG